MPTHALGAGPLLRPTGPRSPACARAKQPGKVDYGKSWYTETRQGARPFKTVREEIEWRRKANLEANNGRDRKDLITDAWDGSEYRGSPWNIGTVIALVSVLTPLAGLAFAFFSYGKLWG